MECVPVTDGPALEHFPLADGEPGHVQPLVATVQPGNLHNLLCPVLRNANSARWEHTQLEGSKKLAACLAHQGGRLHKESDACRARSPPVRWQQGRPRRQPRTLFLLLPRAGQGGQRAVAKPGGDEPRHGSQRHRLQGQREGGRPGWTGCRAVPLQQCNCEK